MPCEIGSSSRILACSSWNCMLNGGDGRPEAGLRVKAEATGAHFRADCRCFCSVFALTLSVALLKPVK